MVEPRFRGNEFELLLLATLLRDLDEDDPYAEELRYVLSRRLRQAKSWDPELDRLFDRVMLSRRRRRPRLDDAREIATAVLDGFRKSFQEAVERRIDKLSSEIDELREQQSSLSKAVQTGSIEQTNLKDSLHDFVWLLSSGAKPEAVATQRYVPARLYVTDPTPDEAHREALLKALTKFLEPFDLERSYDLPDEAGSWWKKLFLRTKSAVTHEEVQKRLQKAERALQNQYLEKPQAEANQMQASAASDLITALKDTPTACVQVGSLLLVKGKDHAGQPAVMARTLTFRELQALEENQAMLRQPDQVLKWLEGCTKAKRDLPTKEKP